MADQTQLGRIGYLLGAVTIAVMMIGTAVVSNHLSAANAQNVVAGPVSVSLPR